jgi:hypothetical protein
MSITYTWSFPQFDVAKAEDGLTDVVKTIHWRYDATDGKVSCGCYGTVALDAPNPSDFTPYSALTADWCIAACSDKLDMTEINQKLEDQIALLNNPPVVPMVPPFAALS